MALIENSKGLNIKTTSEQEFEVSGTVKYSAEYDTYYCGAWSYPAAIVTEILRE